MKNEFIKLSGILCLITLIAALLLAGVNTITVDRIAQAADKASQEAMASILTDADSFEKLSDNISEGKKGNETVGWCVTVKTNGFGGEIEMMVGLSTDKTVLGIEILNHGETAGLGAKATTPDFKKQFSGKSTELSVAKTPTDSPDEIQAITGATITSRAVCNGIKEATSQLEKQLSGGSN